MAGEGHSLPAFQERQTMLRLHDTEIHGNVSGRARRATVREFDQLIDQTPVWHAAHFALLQVREQQVCRRFAVLSAIPRKAWGYLRYGILHNDGPEIAQAWAWAVFYVLALRQANYDCAMFAHWVAPREGEKE